MIKFFIIFVLFTSCVYHKQKVELTSTPTKQVFELSSNEEAFSFIFSDDYFNFKEFVSKNENVLNLPNANGQFLLHEAVKLKRELICVLLIKHGSDPTILDEADKSTFDLITDYEDKENWMNILEGRGIDPEHMKNNVIDLVMTTAQDNQADAIKKLTIYFDSGADINSRNNREYTLLIIAATKNLPLVVEFLCQQEGVDINAKAGRYTALTMTKKLLKRDPSLQVIIDILLKYEGQ